MKFVFVHKIELMLHADYGEYSTSAEWLAGRLMRPFDRNFSGQWCDMIGSNKESTMSIYSYMCFINYKTDEHSTLKSIDVMIHKSD